MLGVYSGHTYNFISTSYRLLSVIVVYFIVYKIARLPNRKGRHRLIINKPGYLVCCTVFVKSTGMRYISLCFNLSFMIKIVSCCCVSDHLLLFFLSIYFFKLITYLNLLKVCLAYHYFLCCTLFSWAMQRFDGKRNGHVWPTDMEFINPVLFLAPLLVTQSRSEFMVHANKQAYADFSQF